MECKKKPLENVIFFIDKNGRFCSKRWSVHLEVTTLNDLWSTKHEEFVSCIKMCRGAFWKIMESSGILHENFFGKVLPATWKIMQIQ